MSFTGDLLPASWFWTAHVLFGALLVFALARAPWDLFKATDRQHAFLGACVALLILWSMRAGVTPGVGFHTLGMTALTLMFGWRFALLAGALVVAGCTLNGLGDWYAFSVNALLAAAVPVLVSHGLYRIVDRRLPNNFFIYVFLCAFFGGGLAMAASAFATLGVLVASATYSLARLQYEYLPYFPLMIFPEALLNGMVMTILVGMRPRWVSTFDDERYLRPR